MIPAYNAQVTVAMVQQKTANTRSERLKQTQGAARKSSHTAGDHFRFLSLDREQTLQLFQTRFSILVVLLDIRPRGCRRSWDVIGVVVVVIMYSMLSCNALLLLCVPSLVAGTGRHNAL